MNFKEGVECIHSANSDFELITIKPVQQSIALSLTLSSNMATPDECLGHQIRAERSKKIEKLLKSPLETPDENLKVVIKKGPTSEETSLKGLEEFFAIKSGWKVIEDGGVLSIPVVEFRMMDQPKPQDFGMINYM